jgi:hypothetical protein
MGGIAMLAAENMLKALSEEKGTENYKDCNDDYDFSKVLELFEDDVDPTYEVACSDGQKRNLLLK